MLRGAARREKTRIRRQIPVSAERSADAEGLFFLARYRGWFELNEHPTVDYTQAEKGALSRGGLVGCAAGWPVLVEFGKLRGFGGIYGHTRGSAGAHVRNAAFGVGDQR